MGPSPWTRLAWVCYLGALRRVPPWGGPPQPVTLLLPMCMLCMLPALWLHTSVWRLEATLLYFVILQVLIEGFQGGDEREVCTVAALCLVWHALQAQKKQELLLQASVGLYFACFVPLVWSLTQPTPNGWMLWLLCDVSLTCLDVSLRLYGLVFPS
jgi:hypothetical protein